jgi:hypothetical protein
MYHYILSKSKEIKIFHDDKRLHFRLYAKENSPQKRKEIHLIRNGQERMNLTSWINK